MPTLRNKFDELLEVSETLFSEWRIWEFRQSPLEAAAELKKIAKPRVPWETFKVRKKRADMKTVSKFNGENTTKINALKLKKVQNELPNIYLKEQTEYIWNQINKFRDSVEDRQSREAWQTVNEVSGRKSTAKAKLKSTGQGERIHLRKQYLLGNHPKVMDESITKIISKQLDIKLGQITSKKSTQY